MTAASTPTGTVSDIASIAGAEAAWKALDKVGNTTYFQGQRAYPNWWKYDFGSGNSATVNRYTMASKNNADYNRAPTDFTLEGSNDDTNWTTLDTQASLTWAQDETQSPSEKFIHLNKAFSTSDELRPV